MCVDVDVRLLSLGLCLSLGVCPPPPPFPLSLSQVALMQQIKNDFASVTSFAHKVKTSLPPMKAKI
jgi:hypothetical protein